MKRAISLVLTLLLVACCTSVTKEEKERFCHFLTATTFRDSSLYQIPTDSLFGYSLPIDTQKERLYVYVLKADCSVCIGQALDCYRCYLTTDPVSPFYFLSTVWDMGIFDYYFKTEFDCEPACYRYNLSDGSRLPDGLYTVREGKLSSFSSWSIW